MGATFIVTLREAFEAALILGIIYTYLQKIGARDGYRYVTWGGTLGLLASLGMGIGVGYLSGPLLDWGPDVVGAVVIFAAVVLLTWHAWWMRRHAQAIRGQVQHRIDEARAARSLWVVGLIAFTGVFREGAETVLFLWGIMAQAASTTAWEGLVGGVAGVVTAAAIGWAIFHGGRHLSLSRFFSVTTVFIMLLAAGLFSTGIGRLQGMGLLPLGEPLWDTSSLLSDRTVLGSFLTGLVGYRARPSGLEVMGYAAYLITAAALLWGRRSGRRGRERHTAVSVVARPD
jgi:high-affinity iron transporter